MRFNLRGEFYATQCLGYFLFYCSKLLAKGIAYTSFEVCFISFEVAGTISFEHICTQLFRKRVTKAFASSCNNSKRSAGKIYREQSQEWTESFHLTEQKV